MKIRAIGITVLLSLVYGCASVPMAPTDQSELAKAYNPPSEGNAGIYVFRKDTSVGGALKKDVWVDGQCVGETAKGVFFYHEVSGDQEHTISTESEFSPNDLVVYMQNGMHYFFEQFIKLGVFVGGAGLKQVSEEEGKKEMTDLGMAKKGSCSKS